jgi:hypothetical protein
LRQCYSFGEAHRPTPVGLENGGLLHLEGSVYP